MKRAWSDAEKETLRREYEAGNDDAEIGWHLGRSTGSVSNARQAFGIERPRETLKRAPEWNAEELRVAAEMYARGTPNDVIAAAVGRTRISIKRLVTDRGLTRDANYIPEPSSFDTEAEKWRLVKDAPSYAVSDAGRVMSLQPGNQGRMIAQWQDGRGYRHATLQVSRRNKRFSVHRLVAIAFIGDPPTADHEAAHGDGVPFHNSVGNLRWATKAENQADRLLHGTAARGEGGRFIPTANMVSLAEAARVPVARPTLPLAGCTNDLLGAGRV